MVLWGLWMARRHLTGVVLRALGSKRGADDSGEMLSYRTAVFGTLVGTAYIVCWFRSAGMDGRVLALYVFATFIICVGMARIVSQAGLLYLREPISAQVFSVYVVGSVAIALLSGLGHRVVASTGRGEEAGYLRGLGAADVIDRAALSAPGKALQKERWAGVVDAVGSHTLANACAQTRCGGAVAACGLAQGMDLPLTVAPLILRGVRLLGIDSVMCPVPRRTAAWQHLAEELDRARLDAITHEISLGEAIEAGRQILAGSVRGRLVVDVNR
jgi:NADPH-dependent curcumin reductase CurA